MSRIGKTKFEEFLESDNYKKRVLNQLEDYDKLKFRVDNFLRRAKNYFPEKNDCKAKEEIKSNGYRETAEQRANHEKKPVLWYINKALCFAPDGSEAMARAYAARSKIYLKEGLYSFCKRDIDRALALNDCPDELKRELENRKEVCASKIFTEQVNERETIGLVKRPRKNIPFMADVLDCTEDDTFGRKMMATCDLNPGDVLLNDYPVILAINRESMYSNCYHCAQNNFFNLIPCPKTIKVMFCSEECKKVANEGYYKYESQIVDLMYRWIKNILPIRILLKALINMGIMELDTIVKKKNKNQKKKSKQDWLGDNFGLPGTVSTPADIVNHKDKTHITALIFLNDLKEKRSSDNEKQHIAYCALVTYILKRFTNVCQDCIPSVKRDLIIELIYHFNMVVSANAFDIPRTHDHDKETTLPQVVGEMISYIPSLFNHSCIANAAYIPSNKAGKFDIVAIRPIKLGEQVFLNYLPRLRSLGYQVKNPMQRKKALENVYFFDCNCKACKPDCEVEKKKGELWSLDELPQLEAEQLVTKSPVEYKEQIEETLNRLKKYYSSDKYKFVEKYINSICFVNVVQKQQASTEVQPIAGTSSSGV